MNDDIEFALEILKSGWPKVADAVSKSALGKITTLPSYIDKNFYIKTETEEFVLKIASSQTTTQALDLENCAMLRLASYPSAWRFPLPQCSEPDHTLTYFHQKKGSGPWRARMVNFIPGKIYQSLETRSPALLENLGACVGYLTKTLADMPANFGAADHDWNIMHAFKYLNYAQHLTDHTLSRKITRYAAQWNNIAPTLDKVLQKGIIHNDANDLNVIANDVEQRVSAVIDFGDLCYTYLIADLAIACTYALPYHDQPLQALRHIAKGYNALRHITEDEAEIFHLVVIARLCQSILMATRASTSNPDNTHSQVSQIQVRRFLTRWEGISANDVYHILIMANDQ